MGERIITPNMTPFQKFIPGDHVAHISMGNGIVQPREYMPSAKFNEMELVVTVKYERGPGYIGKYDARWFELNPRFLFHRIESTTPTPIPEKDAL